MQTNSKLITCITPSKNGMEIVKKLKEEKGIITANRSHARGSLNIGNKIKYEEVEIITVTVDESQSQEIFEYLYELAEIQKPHHGFILQNDLMRSTAYALPLADS